MKISEKRMTVLREHIRAESEHDMEALLAGMTNDSSLAAPNLHFVLASRHLERIADHATNIAEDVLFWVRGLEVRHGRARMLEAQEDAKAS